MSDTPETDANEEAIKYRETYGCECSLHEPIIIWPEFARRLERERDEAMDVLSYLSHYLSCGIGDENTTPQQYKERILDGIKFLIEQSKQINLDTRK